MKQETLIQKAGGRDAIAAALRIEPESLAKWRQNGGIPIKHLRWFCDATGKKAGAILHLFNNGGTK